MIDIDRAMLDPSDVFATPEAVADHAELTNQQKINILRQWEYDEQEMSVAEEENMAADSTGNDTIDRIHRLLLQLRADKDAKAP